ncbi:DUF4309 domain-containing protein [Shimazuella soli]|uniref:DUF4309 domain-containing protein n=1 Tax=Shimazuella soli TaxID=1892854 RepID=UPI001F0F233B
MITSLTLGGLLFNNVVPNMVEATSVYMYTEKQQVQQIMKLAKQGKATNTGNFRLLSTGKKDIIKQWGKPDKQSKYMIFYQKKEARFNLNADSSYDDKDLVIGIDSYDSRNKSIHLKTVERTLGKPLYTVQEQGKYVIYYEAGKYLLSFTFSRPSKKNANPTFLAVHVETNSN